MRAREVGAEKGAQGNLHAPEKWERIISSYASSERRADAPRGRFSRYRPHPCSVAQMRQRFVDRLVGLRSQLHETFADRPRYTAPVLRIELRSRTTCGPFATPCVFGRYQGTMCTCTVSIGSRSAGRRIMRRFHGNTWRSFGSMRWETPSPTNSPCPHLHKRAPDSAPGQS